jgi:endoglycosylceramidase
MILHGLNIANSAKYRPQGVSWHTEADYKRMVGWGFNTIRLLMFWSFIEPEEGVYDDAYLDRVAERVGWATHHGLYVILDMHQDLYGKKFSEDGAPEWATRDDGHPFEMIQPWWVNYCSPAVKAAFTHLYADADLKQHYYDAWAYVASRFGSNPTVIGYDLQNEPFFGDHSLFCFESEALLPFYKGAIKAVRAVDPDAIIYFEPMIITSTGFPSFLPRIDDPRAVYMPHFYQFELHEGGKPYNGNDNIIVSAALTRSTEAAKHRVPWVLGELGISDTVGNFDLHLNDLMRVLDTYAAGWTYYDYEKGSGQSILDYDGNEKPNLIPLIRTYPHKVAGTIREFSYNPKTRVFELTFDEREGVTGPTEIYVPSTRVYRGQFVVISTDPEGRWSYTFDPVREVIALTADPRSSTHTVRIEPKHE